MIIENTNFIYRNCKESSKHEGKELNKHISNYWKLCIRIGGKKMCSKNFSAFKNQYIVKKTGIFVVCTAWVKVYKDALLWAILSMGFPQKSEN